MSWKLQKSLNNSGIDLKKIKNLIALLVILSISSLTITQPEQEIEASTLSSAIDTFSDSYLTKLSPHEVQILANIVYFSHELAVVDVIVQQVAVDLLGSIWNIRQARLNYESDQSLVKLHEDMKDFQEKVVLQKKLSDGWKTSTKLAEALAEAQEASAFAQAFEQFRTLMQQELQSNIAVAWKNIHSGLSRDVKVLADTKLTLEFITQIYQSLVKEQKQESADLEDARSITLACQAADTLQNSCWQAITTAMKITAFETAIETTSIPLLKTWYSKLYKQVQSLEPQYKTILMHDAKGNLIDSDELLPAIS